MSILRAATFALVLTTLGVAQQTISLPTEDGGRICADLYGQGPRAGWAPMSLFERDGKVIRPRPALDALNAAAAK